MGNTINNDMQTEIYKTTVTEFFFFFSGLSFSLPDFKRFIKNQRLDPPIFIILP